MYKTNFVYAPCIENYQTVLFDPLIGVSPFSITSCLTS